MFGFFLVPATAFAYSFAIGALITRGSSLQDALKGAVRQFTRDRKIGSYDDLASNGYVPTPKQRANVLKRVQRLNDPVAFAEAWIDGRWDTPDLVTLLTVLARNQAAENEPGVGDWGLRVGD